MDLEAIKARLAAATPGPWKVRPCEDGRLTRIETTGDTFESRKTVARTASMFGRPHVHYEKGAPNAALIAHAPTDLAALVAEVERLRESILAALDNLENGPEGPITAEGALRRALSDAT